MKLNVQQLATSGGVAPPPRSGHGAALVNGDTLVVIGGECDDLCLGDCWAGKISGNSVTPIPAPLLVVEGLLPPLKAACALSVRMASRPWPGIN